MGIFNLFKKKKEDKMICRVCGLEITKGDSYGKNEDGTYVHERCYKEENPKEKICQSCQMSIQPGQKYTKQMGLYFHRGCWKKERAAVPI